MPPSPSGFLMSHVGPFLNLFVCVVIVGFNVAFGGPLRKACAERGNQQRWALLPWLLQWWTWAWVFWLLIYIVRLAASWNRWDHETVLGALFVLSDLNSVCLIMMTVALSRGESVSLHYYRAVALLLLLAIAVWDLLLWLCGLALTEGDTPGLFLQVWSAALSVTAPLVMGRLFVQRYATQSIWWIGLFYGLTQVFAYGALLLPDGRVATVTTAQPVTFMPDSRGFVRTEVTESGRYQHQLLRSDGRREMNGTIARQLMDAFHGKLDPITGMRIYLQLCFDEILFALLALLKLIYGAQMLATLRIAPANMEQLLRSCDRPTGASLVEKWKAFYWPLIVLSLLVAFFVVALYGMGVLVMLASIAAPLSAVLTLTKKGRSLVSRFVREQAGSIFVPLSGQGRRE